KVFVDSWGNPICYIRWPFGGPSGGGGGLELNQAPNWVLNKAGQTVDPQDPERTLLDPDWYNNTNLRDPVINTVGHPLSNPATNLSAVILSAGRDKKLGFSGYQPTGYSGYFLRTSGDEDDNLYGFRIKGVGRTN